MWLLYTNKQKKTITLNENTFFPAAAFLCSRCALPFDVVVLLLLSLVCYCNKYNMLLTCTQRELCVKLVRSE